jgi:hypothetical protein
MADRSVMEKIDPNLFFPLLYEEYKLPQIEHMLDLESMKLNSLQEMYDKNRLYFGQKMNKQSIDGLLTELKPEIDSFLQCKEVQPVKWRFCDGRDVRYLDSSIGEGYFLGQMNIILSGLCYLSTGNLPGAMGFLGFSLVAYLRSYLKEQKLLGEYTGQYNHGIKEVILPDKPKVIITGTLAHEYGHHVQDNMGISQSPAFIPYQEGICRGIERHIGKLYAETEDNPAYLYDPINTTVGELRSVYLDLCKSYKKQPNDSLLKTPSWVDDIESQSRHYLCRPTLHALGNTFFYLWEDKFGKDTYAIAAAMFAMCSKASDTFDEKKLDQILREQL